MKHSQTILLILTVVLLTSCGPVASPEPVATVESVPFLPPATATQTLEPTATPLPGVEIIPIDQMDGEIPWLTAPGRRPATLYFGFNVNSYPFNNVLVRQAFSAAVDREAIVANALRLHWQDAVPATTYAPAEILGRRLYNQVGIPFDPERARELLAEAGYPDGVGFPMVRVATNLRSQDAAPGSYIQFTEAIAQMWEEHLGVTVKVLEYSDTSVYYAFITENKSGVDIHRAAFNWSDETGEMDPDWVFTIFYGESEYDYNFSGFTNPQYDQLFEAARSSNDPAERQLMYLELERLLVETEAVVIPIFHWRMP